MKRKLLIPFAVFVVLILMGCPTPMDPISDSSGETNDVERAEAEWWWRRAKPEPSETGLFPDARSEQIALRGYWGWEFEPVARSEDERVVIGTATNEDGYDRGWISVEAGTTVGVYWITGERRGYGWAFGPYAIGTVAEDDTDERSSRWIYSRLRGRFGLFYLDLYDQYLATAASISDGDDDWVYLVRGFDTEGTELEATIEGSTVTGIETVGVPPAANQPPIVSFYDGDLLVDGAGDSLTNGVYVEGGTLNGAPYYVIGEGTLDERFVYLGVDESFTYFAWIVDDTLPGAMTAEPTSEVYYLSVMSGSAQIVKFPTPTGWSLGGQGTAPEPTIATLPFSADKDYVSGPEYLDGTTLTVQYLFFDADGDPEGATGFQWYRCDPDGTNPTAVSGAIDRSYTVDSTVDAGFAFTVEITPVDATGTIGDAVMSDPSFPVTSGPS